MQAVTKFEVGARLAAHGGDGLTQVSPISVRDAFVAGDGKKQYPPLTQIMFNRIPLSAYTRVHRPELVFQNIISET